MLVISADDALVYITLLGDRRMQTKTVESCPSRLGIYLFEEM